MNYRFLFIVFFLKIYFFQSQTHDFTFRDLNTSNGLSDDNVNSIVQDKLGQIWFATRGGLNKYDGNKFTVYRNIPGNNNTISSSEVIDVLSDSDGFIWVATINGLNKYDPRTNTTKRFFSRATAYSLSNSFVKSSLEIPGGNIWFGTANGVSIYEKKENRFINILKRDPKDGFRSINNMVTDHKNNVWLATNEGIVHVQRDGGFKIEEHKLTTSKTNFAVNALLEISPGIIGVASRHNGFLYFKTDTKELIRPEGIDLPINIDIRDIEIDDNQNIWLATTIGLYIIKPSKETIYLKGGAIESYNTTYKSLRAIYKDKNGVMWLGTKDKGAFTWDKSYQNFNHYKNQKIVNNITNSIVEGEDAIIYTATAGGVINTLNKKGEIDKFFKIEGLEKNTKRPIKSLHYQKPNLLFIGTLHGGLIVVDVKTKKIRNDIISKELKNYIALVSVYDIKTDSKGNLYIGTFGKGLVKYNLRSKRFRVFGTLDLATKYVKTIYIDENDNLLVAGAGGVTALQFNNKDEVSKTNYFKEERYKSFNINYIYKDSNHTVWAGTKTRGLYKLEGKSFKKVEIPRRNIFFTVYSILEGNKGVLWLSTDRGIVKYNTLNKKTKVYDQKEIIANNNFRQNSCLKVNDQIYFGDLQGFTCFNQKKLKKITINLPKVILSDLKIKNKVVPITDKNGVLPKSLNHTKTLELEYNNANFSISYALPNYINSKENTYAYRLQGLDDAWTYTKLTEAFFTLQKPGKYTFQVKAANYDNIWTKKTTTLNIIVRPAPWKTWWAKTIYLIVFFSLVFGISRIIQSRSRLKDRLELELVAKKNTEELNTAKLDFFTNISHEFRTPLTLIIGPLQKILQNYSGTNDTYKKLKVIEGSTNHLLRLINRLMDFRKLESNQFQLQAAEGNIVEFLKEIYLSFCEHAKNGNYTYKFIAEQEEIFVFYDRYKLERVFFNLISNAFRYTEKGGNIYVKIKRAKENVIVDVEDSGVGIEEEFIDKIFDRFFEIGIHKQTQADYTKGTGIGLSIVKNIVKLHHGDVFVKNLNPKGAQFSVKLKLGKEHLSEKEVVKNFKKSDDVSQYVTQIAMPKEDVNKNVTELFNEEKKHTILIVENNIVLRAFIKEILKPSYNIVEAENGKIAFQKAIQHIPDLVISDVVMPEMVGTELCSRLKTTIETSHIPVVLLTSRTSLVYKFEGLESGADDYITKPFNLKEFALKIKNLLNTQQQIKDKLVASNNYDFVPTRFMSLDKKLLEKTHQIIKINLANENFSVTQFAEELGVSRSLLFTKIKAWTNLTPKDFIQQTRLKHAAKLLETTNYSVSEVAYKVGFKRSKYFSQCFKKQHGLTPTEFSKKFTIDFS